MFVAIEILFVLMVLHEFPEISLFENISLFPNPAQNEATLALSLVTSSVVNVTVYDVTGKIVSNVFNGNLNEGQTNLFINTTDFSNGMYYFRIVQEEKESKVMKIVIK